MTELEKDIRLIAATIQKYGTAFDQKLDIPKRDAEKILVHLNEAFHNDIEVVTDEVYDIFFDWFKDEFPASKVLTQIGAKVTQSEVKLLVPTGSMDKVPAAQLAKHHKHSSYVVTAKNDGMSLMILYSGGVPVQAFTRGDGVMGQDCSNILPSLKIPKRIKIKADFLVRTEFIIRDKVFDTVFAKEAGGKFVTARNMAGGYLRRNLSSSTLGKFDVIAFEIQKGVGAGTPQSKQLKLLSSLGFDLPLYKIVKDFNTLSELLSQFKKRNPYRMDGLVVAADIAYKIKAGNPKHAFAYKENVLEDSVVVTVERVEWNETRHTRFAPRVYFAPTKIGGVTVQFATGFNYYFMTNGHPYKDRAKHQDKKPIGVGAKIRVIRSGDVIPYIIDVVKPARRASVPDVPYQLDANGINASATAAKTSTRNRILNIEHFFTGLGIKGLKAATLSKLFDAGYTSVARLMKARRSDIVGLPSIGETAADNIMTAIKKAKQGATFAQLAYASGAFGDKFGYDRLAAIEQMYPNIQKLTETKSVTQLEALVRDVAGINKMAEQFVDGVPAWHMFLKLTKLPLVQPEVIKTTGSRTKGVRVLLTGIRDAEFVKRVIQNGGEEASTVKNATHIITKLGTSNNKTAAAQDAGKPVMTIDQFTKKYKV